MPPKSAVCRTAFVALLILSFSVNVALGLYVLMGVNGESKAEIPVKACDVVCTNAVSVAHQETNTVPKAIAQVVTNAPPVKPVEPSPLKVLSGTYEKASSSYTIELQGLVDHTNIGKYVEISPFAPLAVSYRRFKVTQGDGNTRELRDHTTLTFSPAEADRPFVVDKTYRLTLKKGLPGATTNDLPLAQEEMRIFTVQDPRERLHLRGNPNFSHWENCFTFPLSTDIDEAQDLSEFIDISPKIPIRVEKRSYSWESGCNVCVFPADNEKPFEANVKYTVTLKKGLRAKDGKEILPLRADYVDSFKGPEWEESRAFATEGTFFRLDSKVWELPIKSVNADSLNVAVSKIYPNRLAEYVLAQACILKSDRWWCRSTWEELAADYVQKMGERKIALPLVRNRKNYSSLSFDTLGIMRRPGAYGIKVEGGESRLVVLTDLALAVMRGDHEYMVNVRTLTGNKPVTNAVVKLYSRKMQPLAATTTDARGFARLAYAALTDKDDGVGVIFAQRGEDATYISASDFTRGMARKADFTHVTSRAAGMGATLFAERGICRPGESIGLFAYLREAVTLKAKGGVPLVMEVRNPAGNLVSSETLTGSETGFYKTYVKIEPSAATGEYTYELRMPGGKPGSWASGRGTFQVGEYVPDRVKLETKFASETVRPGEALELKGTANYYFGAPLRWGRVDIDVRESIRPFTPAEWKGFSFGVQKPGPKRKAPVVRTFKAKGEVLIGAFEAKIDVDRRPDAPTLPVEYRAVTTVKPGTGRTVSSTTSLFCHYRDFYVGLKDAGARDGSRRVHVAAVTPQEKPHQLNVTAYSYVLTRKEWDYRLVQKEGRTTYEWQESGHDYAKHALKLVAVPGAAGVYEAEIKMPQNGSYELSVLDGSNVVCATMSFWHAAGESGERSRNPSVMKFDLDREIYAPGGVARVSFDALAPGEAVVMAGSAAIDAAFSCRVKAGRNTIEVPIAANCAEGSYFAGVTVVCDIGDDARLPKRLSGLVRMNVDQSARELKVKMDMPSISRPRGSAKIGLSVTDAQGRPAAAEVQVWAVDRGILSLTAWKTPDMWRRFFGAANCPFLINDTYKDFYPELRVVNGKIGGGDALSGFMVQDKSVLKAPAILALQTVLVPTTGVAEVTFDNLPDFTGSLLVSAVAADALRAGSESAELVMRDKLSLEMSAPQFVAPNDRFNVSFVCFNHEEEGTRAKWSVTTKGLDLRDPKAARGTLDLAMGEQVPVKIPVTVRPDAVTLDAAELVAVLQIGAVAVTNTVRLAARPARTVTTRMTNLMVQPGRKVTFSDADAGMASYVRGDVWIGSPSLAMVGAIKALDDYPCRCAEQSTSRAFPYLMMKTLVARGIFPAAYDAETTLRINRTRALLSTMRLSDGYYSMWPGWDWSWAEASIYVWHFLLEAHERGYALDPEERVVIAANLRRYVNNRDHRISDRAYATYVLSLADASFVEGAAHAILADSDAQPFDRFLAGAALIKANFARAGAEAIKKVWQTPFYTLKKDYIHSGLDSETRRIGLALWILNDVLPDADVIARLSNILLQRRNDDGSWGTTQNNAWAALGLARAAAKSGARGNVRFMTGGAAEPILADGKSVHKNLARGFSFAIDNQDTSPVFVSLRHMGVPEKNESVTNGFAVTREYRVPFAADSRLICKVGDLITVRLTVKSTVDCENIVLSDMLPGGFDIEDERLATRGFNLMTARDDDRADDRRENKLDIRRIEKRGDRFIALGNVYKGEGWVEYRIRAVTPGVYALPDVSMDAMYRPGLKGLMTTSETFEVTE